VLQFKIEDVNVKAAGFVIMSSGRKNGKWKTENVNINP
jgi:hypothetical protein